MPYACFTFDDDTNSAMRGVAARIASDSAFLPEEPPFHVPIIGSLHEYSQEAVFAAFGAAPEVPVGRFVDWELKASQLRATVELSNGATALMSHLQAALPKGKPWRAYYVTLGSVASIDAARHDDFLAAVKAAFPIDPSVIFHANRLEFNMTPAAAKPAPPPKPPQQAKSNNVVAENKSNSTSNMPSKASAERMDIARPSKALNPMAAPFAPSEAVMAVPAAQRQKAKKKQKKPHQKRAGASPHLKWERNAPSETSASTGRTSIDELIKQAGTGSTAHKLQHKLKHSAQRAAAIGKARGQQGERVVRVVSGEQ